MQLNTLHSYSREYWNTELETGHYIPFEFFGNMSQNHTGPTPVSRTQNNKYERRALKPRV